MKTIFLFVFIIFNNNYLFSSNLEENIETCNSCHSVENVINDPLIPSINGQEFFYIYTQLKDYKAGRRSHEIMTDIASDLSKDDMKALAQFYSEKKWLPYAINKDYDSESIEKIVSSGGRNACTKCHVGFKGNSGVPTIGGQKIHLLKSYDACF